MREHTHLSSMVGFVSKHVAQHFRTNRPRLSPSVSEKFLGAATRTAERFSEHFRAASGALGQCRAGLPRRAARAIDLWRNLHVRSCKPDPLGADIVHVREDRRDGADVAGRFGSPGGRVKMFDQKLIYAIVGGKYLDRGSAELSVNFVLTRGHGSRLLDLMILPGRGETGNYRRLAAKILWCRVNALLVHLELICPVIRTSSTGRFNGIQSVDPAMLPPREPICPAVLNQN
jgi:hypothetical protein